MTSIIITIGEAVRGWIIPAVYRQVIKITLIWQDKSRFEVLTAVTMKMAVFWAVVPYSLLEVYRHFRGAFSLHHRPDDRGHLQDKRHMLKCIQPELVPLPWPYAVAGLLSSSWHFRVLGLVAC
jgi:hypothetical protein